MPGSVEQLGELDLESVLGRPGQPVANGALGEDRRERPRRTRTPAPTFFRGIARVGWSTTSSSSSNRIAARVEPDRPAARRSRTRCGWWLRRCRGHGARAADRSLIVTCSAPGSAGGSSPAVEIRPLPRQVVMVEHDSAVVPLEYPRGCSSAVDVERQRAQVLDDDEGGGVERMLERRRIHRGGRAQREPRHLDVAGDGRALQVARDSPDREAERFQCASPLGCFDRHTVGAAEAEGDEDGVGAHHPTIGPGAGPIARVGVRLLLELVAAATGGRTASPARRRVGRPAIPADRASRAPTGARTPRARPARDRGVWARDRA